jgi:arginyl-tRNA synthetase
MRQFSIKERNEIMSHAADAILADDPQGLIEYFNNSYTTKFENGKTIANKIIDKYFPDCSDMFREKLHNIMIDFVFNFEKSMEQSKEEERVLRDFGKKLVESQIDIPPEFRKIVDENFWELLGGDEK